MARARASVDDGRGRVCEQPTPEPIVLPEAIGTLRAEAIRLVKKAWVNGTVLRYCFMTDTGWDGPAAQQKVVRNAFREWEALGIGLRFVEVKEPREAEIRIGFMQGDGSWSYLGTDVLRQAPTERTMNFGWDLTTTWGLATALHEIGHTLGMPHEHQNPLAGLVWDEAAVIAYFSGPPNNWDEVKIRRNILDKLPRSHVEGSNWDPKSIMHYPFAPGLILRPPAYNSKGVGENTALSADDKAWVRGFYPGKPKVQKISAMQLEIVAPEIGAQRDFSFTPDATRDYQVQTLGQSDAKVVVFEVREGEPRHFAAEDDSGQDSNARLVLKMVKGREYVIRVRVHYAANTEGVGLLVA